MNGRPVQRPAANSEGRKRAQPVPAVELPIEITAVCPRCEEGVRLSLVSIGSDAMPGRLTVNPEYARPHTCADLRPQEPPC